MSVSFPDLPPWIRSRKSRAFLDLPAPTRFMMSIWTADEMWNGSYCIEFGGNGIYGFMRSREWSWTAHAYAWHLAFGLPNEYFEPGRKWEVHHLCGNRHCVNVLHLELMSIAEHHAEHRPTMCKKGLHPLLTPDDWYETKDGKRRCRECTKEYNLARYHALSDEEKRERSVANYQREKAKRN